MMSLRAWLALLLVYLAYLIIGGFTFRAIEGGDDTNCTEEADACNKWINFSRHIEAIKGKIKNTAMSQCSGQI